MNKVQIGRVEKVACRICGEEHLLFATEEQWENYTRGMKVQDAFPKMSADDRELLISQTCGKCFDKMFGDEE